VDERGFIPRELRFGLLQLLTLLGFLERGLRLSELRPGALLFHVLSRLLERGLVLSQLRLGLPQRLLERPGIDDEQHLPPAHQRALGEGNPLEEAFDAGADLHRLHRLGLADMVRVDGNGLLGDGGDHHRRALGRLGRLLRTSTSAERRDHEALRDPNGRDESPRQAVSLHSRPPVPHDLSRANAITVTRVACSRSAGAFRPRCARPFDYFSAEAARN
jgi:hypothetical protein